MLVIITAISRLYRWQESFVIDTDIADKPKRMVVPPNHFRVMLADKPQSHVALKRVVKERTELNATALAKVVAYLTVFAAGHAKPNLKAHRLRYLRKLLNALDGGLFHFFLK